MVLLAQWLKIKQPHNDLAPLVLSTAMPLLLPHLRLPRHLPPQLLLKVVATE